MTITATFNDYEEMLAFAGKIVSGVMLNEGFAPEEEAPKKKKKATAAPVPDETPENETADLAPAETAPTAKEQVYTLEDVRATLAALNKSGKRAEVKEILKAAGAEKLSEVDPSNYAMIMQKAGEYNA